MSIDTPQQLSTRPLTARSVIASNLLGMDPPELSARALVESGKLHGISPGATRTALSRMVAAGDAISIDEARYRLSGTLLERQQRQVASRRHLGVSVDWDGSWWLAIVRNESRPAAERTALREAARRYGLAELREGVWGRPDNLDVHRAPGARAVIAEQCTVVSGGAPDHDAVWVDAFALDTWVRDAATVIKAMGQSQRRLDDRTIEALPDAFVLAADGVRHVASDPRLPAELLPKKWNGHRLRDALEKFENAYKQTWLAWYRTLG